MTKEELLKAFEEEGKKDSRLAGKTGEELLQMAVHCPHCDKDMFQPDQLEEAIRESTDLDNFLSVCEAKSQFEHAIDEMGTHLDKATKIAAALGFELDALLQVVQKAYEGSIEELPKDPRELN